MNITLEFYVDGSEARLVDLHYNGCLPQDKRGYVTMTTEKLAEEYIKAVEAILALPEQEPKPDPKPEQAPTPTPTPKPEPEPKLTMEDVRKALIEVKKTKGAEGLKTCFDKVGAAKLTDVDPKDYATMYATAKEVLNAK